MQPLQVGLHWLIRLLAVQSQVRSAAELYRGIEVSLLRLLDMSSRYRCPAAPSVVRRSPAWPPLLLAGAHPVDHGEPGKAKTADPSGKVGRVAMRPGEPAREGTISCAPAIPRWTRRL